MYEVNAPTAEPYSSICYIECEWSDGSITRASGVIIGVNDVLTAHHVVYDATRGGYADRITISPGADTSPYTFAYGRFSDVGVIYARSDNWDANGDGLLYAQESQYDMALLGMRSSAISANAGWIAITNTSSDFVGTVDGYPARGTGLMEEAVYADASVEYGVFEIASSLGPGGSGGPLLRTDATGAYVAGVLSSGTSNYTHSTYAGLFGPGNWTWLNDALEANNSVMSGGSGTGGTPLSGAAAGVITYLGTAAGDVLSGTVADENLRGGGGADWVNGMGGTDTAVYVGSRNEYRLGNAEFGFTVADLRPGRDGNDNLANMERVVFSDMTVNLGIGAESRTLAPYQVKTLEELYLAFFDRVPDADGLAFWMTQTRAGQSIDQTADAFYAAALIYPTLTGYNASMGSADFVNVIYRNVLGRAEGADAGGLAFWTQALDSGTETRGSLVTDILYSAHTFKGDATWGWVANLLDNKAYVAHKFAVEMGLGYITPAASIAHGMEIAGAVTATDTSLAIALIGVSDTFSTLG
jgi:V8-like Glu-specific endopeptidase